MRFPRMRFAEGDGTGGGNGQVGLNPATGMPFMPNVQVTGPSSTTTRVRETPAYNEAVQRQEQAFSDQAAAEQAKTQAQIATAQQQAPLFQAEVERQKQILEAQQIARATHQARIDQAQTILNDRINRAANQDDYFPPKQKDETWTRVGIMLSGLGSGMSGQENLALKYIDQRIEREARERQRRSENLFKLADQAKGALADAYRARAEELGDYDAQRAAGWDVVQKQAEALAKSGLIPGIAAQGNEALAKIQGEAAKARLQAEENRKTQVVSQSGHTVTTMGLGNKGGSGMSAEAVTNAESFKQQAKALDEFAQIVKRNPSALKAFQTAHQQNMESEELGKTSLGKGIAFVKGLGGSPMSIDQRIAEAAGDDAQLAKDARRLNMIYPIMKTGEARFFDPVGPLGDAAQRGATEHMNLLTATPEEIQGTAKWFSQSFRDKATAIEQSKMTPEQKAAVAQQQPRSVLPQRAAQSSPMTPRQALQAAKARLQADPTDKTARAVIERLKAGGVQ